jgi:hypothetical protein
MQSIDRGVAPNDGLRWFNRLYMMVTQEVHEKERGDAWQNPQWLAHLDVVFAALYFEALRSVAAGQGTPSAWSAVFEARFSSGIDRIQFAVAGMNAHINHDLALALLKADADFNLVPAAGSPEHLDYLAVNTLLDEVMPAALNMLAGDALGILAEDTGKVGRLLAFWNIRRARDLAWDFADHLRDLEGVTRDAALCVQDTMTGALGRAILTQD